MVLRMKNQYRGRRLPKKGGAWTVYWFKGGGACQERGGGGVFERKGGRGRRRVETPMHTMSLPHFSRIKTSLQESQKGKSNINKTWKAFLNGIFLIHRKSPLLIKAPYKTICSSSFLEHEFPNHRKNIYDHKVNKLGCPRSGLIALNARSF